MKTRILVVDDEADLLDTCKQVLERAGHGVEALGDPLAAARRLEEEPFDLVLTDLKLPGMDGIALMERVRALQPEAPVVMMTAFPSVETAVEAVKKGAFDYLIKPFSPDQLLLAVSRALERRALKRENRSLRAVFGREPAQAMVGPSAAFRRVLAQADQIAGADATVLILGETGTGKEVLARRIHAASVRKTGPLIAINCAAMPAELLESELFGVERGAFTSADRAREGLIECAQGGTLFLDEVADLPVALQSKLLRVLDERAIRRVGGRTLIDVDFRLLAATNRDLDAMVSQRLFREDLFYRLNVVRLSMPALRERAGDVPALALHFLALHARAHGRAMTQIEPEAMARLTEYAWPGNVRELSNVLERAVLVGSGDIITVLDLPDEIALTRAPDPGAASAATPGREGGWAGGAGTAGGATPAGEPAIEASSGCLVATAVTAGVATLASAVPGGARPFAQSKREAVEAFERDYLVGALRATGGNVSQAAARSGLGRSAFQRLLKRYDIRSEDYRKE